MVTLYSTGCPACKVLKKKLEAKGIPYNENNSIEEMAELGITRVPVLLAEGMLLEMTEANRWIAQQQGGDK